MAEKQYPGAGSAGQDAAWEATVQAAAAAFSYPPTPDVAGAVVRRLAPGHARLPAAVPDRRRRPVPVFAILAALAILLAGLLAVPQVRAAVVDVLRIGAVRIFLVAPTPPPAPVPSATPPGPSTRPRSQGTQGAGSVAPSETPAPPATTPRAVTPTRSATPAPLGSVLDLAGETTLVDAQRAVTFTLRLPAYPPDLGAPGHVFVQDLIGPFVVLVWMEPAHPDTVHPDVVRLSLYEMSPSSYIAKIAPTVIQETQVNGLPAIWASGPYFLLSRNGNADVRRLVEGETLIWTENSVTYRLETNLSLAEARGIAESLR
jgi:hypothetical protein